MDWKPRASRLTSLTNRNQSVRPELIIRTPRPLVPHNLSTTAGDHPNGPSRTSSASKRHPEDCSSSKSSPNVRSTRWPKGAAIKIANNLLWNYFFNCELSLEYLRQVSNCKSRVIAAGKHLSHYLWEGECNPDAACNVVGRLGWRISSERPKCSLC